MDQTFTCFLLLLSSSATLGKYVLVEQGKTWPDAQHHCRLFHTDLAPVSSTRDMWLLSQLVDDITAYFWFGLVRNFTDRQKWTWSGAGEVSRFFWESGQPQNGLNEDYGAMRNFRWHDGISSYLLKSFCYSAVVVRERKTWEEALVYCREHHHDLASVASATEMLLMKKELDKKDTTDYAWVGLHYFPGQWLWVDGQPLIYEAWGRGGKPACPDVRLACAALQTEAHGTDVTNATAGSGPDLTGGFVGGILFSDGSDVSGGSEETESVWEARYCEERHYFICY